MRKIVLNHFSKNKLHALLIITLWIEIDKKDFDFEFFNIYFNWFRLNQLNFEFWIRLLFSSRFSSRFSFFFFFAFEFQSSSMCFQRCSWKFFVIAYLTNCIIDSTKTKLWCIDWKTIDWRTFVFFSSSNQLFRHIQK